MTPNIMTQKFEKWTDGLNPLEKRISIFQHIRDIPYCVVPEFRNPTSGPIGLLESMQGSCSPKHFLLGQMFKKLGIPIQYITYPFSWDIEGVEYPLELRELAKSIPIEYHLACKANLENGWVVVDATWDLPLANAGFPVNESWNGVSDTKLAVKPLDEIKHETVQQRMDFVQNKKSSWSEEDHQKTAQFIDAFNKWLVSIRRKYE